MKNKKVMAVLITLMILSASGMAGTAYYAKASSTMPQTAMQPFNGNSDSNTPPELPSGENGNGGMTPPDQSSNDTSSDANTSQEVPNNNSTNEATPPEKPSNDGSQSSKPEGNGPQMGMMSSSKLNTVEMMIMGGCALIFSASGIYLVLSKGTKKSLSESLKGAKRIVIYGVSTAVLTTAISFGGIYGVNHYVLANQSGQPGNMEQAASSVNLTAVKTVTSTETEDNVTYESTESDVSVVLVSDGGSYTLSNAALTKSSGDSSNTESSEFYGLNAGVVVSEGTLNLSDTTINTSAKGANAIFATGENSVIKVSDVTINTTSSSSRGLDATYGGTIEADNVTITTQGTSCATLATDRGEGTVTVTNSKLETNGAGSPIIYSTGTISIDGTTGTSNGAQCVVIEGKNSATVTNSTITSSGKGNRNDVDNCGVMIYQSMSGDADEGTGTFTAENSTLAIDEKSSYYKSAPMFFITNTDAKINLTNTKLIYGSNVLISAIGTDEWGTSGSNGGNVTVNATKQTLKGDIVTDSLSSVTLNLTKSTYTGTINSANTSAGINVSVDADSCWNVTGDSYVTTLTLENDDTSLIKSNGHTIYYDATSNSWLNGKTITLSDGGTLKPAS